MGSAHLGGFHPCGFGRPPLCHQRETDPEELGTVHFNEKFMRLASVVMGSKTRF